MTNEELRDKLLDLLIAKGIIKAESKEVLIKMEEEEGKLVDEILIEGQKVDDMAMKGYLEQITGSPSFDVSKRDLSDSFIAEYSVLIPPALMKKYLFVPIRKDHIQMDVAMVNPLDKKVVDMIQCYSGLLVKPYICHSYGIKKVFKKFYPDKDTDTNYMASEEGFPIFAPFEELFDKAQDLVNRNAEKMMRDPENPEKDAIAVETMEKIIGRTDFLKLFQECFNTMMRKGGSDMHFEAFQSEFRIRLRSDGVLHTQWKMPLSFSRLFSAKIKAMSNLDISLVNKTQDGRIGYNVVFGRNLEFRVSILPTVFGEKCVLRTIDTEGGVVPLDVMGFTEDSIKRFRWGIHQPNGLIYITGPTGSGKTTTLYAALDELNDDETAITTAEDPVEGNIYGIAQVQCTEDGVSFADALKSFLRQDPDIILIGETRDKETADIGIKAASTGHVVFTTLHTNSAIGSINRVLNMGVQPFLLASALRLVHGQRLVRKVCTKCAEDITYTDEQLRDMGVDPKELPIEPHFKHGKGCPACNGTGLKGRMGIFEIFKVTEKLSLMILKGANEQELEVAAKEEYGFMNMREDGLLKACQGLTTLEEVIAATTD